MKILQIEINQSLNSPIDINNIEIKEIMIDSQIAVPLSPEVNINKNDTLWLDIIDKDTTKLEIRKIQDDLNDIFPDNTILVIPKGHKLRFTECPIKYHE